jgi:hypothetical protein
MRRGVLPFVVLVLVLIGLVWSMATMLTHTNVVTIWTQTSPPRAQSQSPATQAAPAPNAVTEASLDHALALYKPALRTPFMADLARHANAPRYEVDLVLDAAARQITGKQTLRYTNQTAQPLSDLVLRLYPNTRYMGGEMTLGELQLGEMQTPWSWSLPDQSALRIGLLKNIAPGETITLSLSFTLSVPNGALGAGYQTFGFFDGLWALPNAYAIIAPRMGEQWQVDDAPNYGDIVFSEMALYRVSLQAPSSYNVVATGVCHSNEATAMATTMAATTCVAGPVRDFALHLGEQYAVERTVVNSLIGEPVQLFSYFLPQHRAAGKRALEIAAHALNSFEQRFGPYPYGELKIFATTTSAGGIEYPMLAGVLHNHYAGNDEYFEWLVAHEVAHQWWYNLVGSNPVQEPWLDEALTQYSTSLYFEDRYGTQVAQGLRQRYFTARFAQERGTRGDRRVGQPTNKFPRWAYFPIVYGKGPLFFDAVRGGSDDVRFAAWLRTYYERHRYGTTSAEDLLQAADDVGLGSVARAAYAEWMLGNGAN